MNLKAFPAGSYTEYDLNLSISCGWFIFRGLVTLYVEMCRSVFFIQPALLLFLKHLPHSSSAISPLIEIVIVICRNSLHNLSCQLKRRCFKFG